MRFTYTYRSSDGQRHTAEIEAESRDVAHARLRTEFGIKPIKVFAADGDMPVVVKASSKSRWLISIMSLLAVLVALALLGIWRNYWGRPPTQFTVNTPHGPVTYTIAPPLPRQAIPGDRRRIEAVYEECVFKSPAERLLARFAEPGRMVVASNDEKPTEADFKACLGEPIRIASTDFTEVVDLKRIIVGMKRELQAYLAGGGTVEQYISELTKRQRLEFSYRENAEKRLSEVLDGQDVHAKKEAYSYWLKANASLKSMGIYELPLPDALRSYQADFGFTE